MNWNECDTWKEDFDKVVLYESDDSLALRMTIIKFPDPEIEIRSKGKWIFVKLNDHGKNYFACTVSRIKGVEPFKIYQDFKELDRFEASID